MPAFSLRAKLGMALLASLALMSSFKLLLDAWEQRARMAAEPGIGPSAYIHRFDEIRSALPQRGVTGYITDQVRDPNRAIAEYHLTQYALAPLLVANSWNEKLVVGNFHSALGPAAIKTKGLEFVRDYGAFVQLLRNPKR